jgi:hypothetical protein
MRNLDMKGKEERAAARLQRESKAHTFLERDGATFSFSIIV